MQHENILEEDNFESNEVNELPLVEFIEEFGEGLLDSVQKQTPPLYDGNPNLFRDLLFDQLKRSPFPAQRHAVHALSTLFFDEDKKSAILNGKMGTGKTYMSIALTHLAHAEGYNTFLVLAPPHLVYKWAREIDQTVDNAKIHVLNGPATIASLISLRNQLNTSSLHDGPTYVILGRVRMRLGFHWKPAVSTRKYHSFENVDSSDENSKKVRETRSYAACPKCNSPVVTEDGDNVTPEKFKSLFQDRRMVCKAKIEGVECGEQLWTLYRPRQPKDYHQVVRDGLCKLPSVGPKTADKILSKFGTSFVAGMMDNNVYDLVNLMDQSGKFIFSDKQAKRMEKSLGRIEFAMSDGSYQASEFIKRYLPKGFFDLAVIDEAHEYSASSSAQGLAMGVISSQVKKVLLCTGTLTKGYASDLFYLLWRINGSQLRDDGYCVNKQKSLGPAEMAFMRDHGVLKDVIKETTAGHYKTARGNNVTVSTRKSPGISPRCITRYLLPNTVFVKLTDISDELPPYKEEYIDIEMEEDQKERYLKMENELDMHLRQSLARGDTSLLGVVINALLAWPDTCFNAEVIKHPRSRQLLHFCPSVFEEDEVSPKEKKLIELSLDAKERGIRTLVYTVYTGKRDTMSRLKSLLDKAGLNFAVMRSTVPADRREEWIEDQVTNHDIDGLICNPACVETGLDLLDFNQICFMQTGLRTNMVEQASKRSWRIGQKLPVDVFFLGYSGTAQTACLELMAKKISVSQSTSGEIPETGLDALNSDGDSIEVALARKLAS